MALAKRVDRSEPFIDKGQLSTLQCSADATTPVMPEQNDVFYAYSSATPDWITDRQFLSE
jgi:hypothetical protein